MNHSIVNFIRRHFRHFNAATLSEAAQAYSQHVESGGKMVVTLGGAMSTAELGISLAQMIREDKVHLISCTGANLEEDLFNLVAHEAYERLPNYRDLTAADEKNLFDRYLNRVTDTCIPEEEAIQRVNRAIFQVWAKAELEGKRLFPHECIYDLLGSGDLTEYYEIDTRDSWVFAAMEANIPIVVPGWEDSTLGNMYAAHLILGNLESSHIVRPGVEYMILLAEWYARESSMNSVGFFQIGGGIAGDFPICVVPMLQYELNTKVPTWGYFCQISDATTSYGSYSGAIPNEKITWGKLDVETPKFIIESDATIVAPLIFAYVLGW